MPSGDGTWMVIRKILVVAIVDDLEKLRRVRQ